MRLIVDIAVSIGADLSGGDAILLCAKFSVISDRPSVVVLFGPSGSGKSSLLHCLAGIIHPASGSIRYEDQCWFDSNKAIFLSPRERAIGLLFQDYSLFPHLTIFQNIAYGLSSDSMAKEAVEIWLKRFRLEGKETKVPRMLSGGERQRVALAQTLAPKPPVVFLDEPFSGLDRPTKKILLREVKEWLHREGVSAIVVLHDLHDAIEIGDELIVMEKGQILQQGKPEEVVKNPISGEVAYILGIENM